MTWRTRVLFQNSTGNMTGPTGGRSATACPTCWLRQLFEDRSGLCDIHRAVILVAAECTASGQQHLPASSRLCWLDGLLQGFAGTTKSTRLCANMLCFSACTCTEGFLQIHVPLRHEQVKKEDPELFQCFQAWPFVVPTVPR